MAFGAREWPRDLVIRSARGGAAARVVDRANNAIVIVYFGPADPLAGSSHAASITRSTHPMHARLRKSLQPKY